MDKRETRYLIPEAPKILVKYQTSKIQKYKTHPPGRPIINGIDSIFYRMGEYLGHFLQPIARSFPSNIKVSKELTNLIKEVTINDQCILASVDMNSLYTNIRQKDAITAKEWALKKTSMGKEEMEFITEALELSIKGNYFRYNKNF